MKIRNAFVTNSSSSSFIISVNDKKLTKHEKLAVKMCFDMLNELVGYNDTEKGMFIYNKTDLEKLDKKAKEINADYSKYHDNEYDFLDEDEQDEDTVRALRYGGLYRYYHDEIAKALEGSSYVVLKDIDHNDAVVNNKLNHIQEIFENEVTVKNELG